MKGSFVFNWKVENFFGLYENFIHNLELKSSIFCAENVNSSQWLLSLHLSDISSEKVGCSLQRVDNAFGEIKINLALKFKKDNKYIDVFFKEQACFQTNSYYDFGKVLNLHDLGHRHKLTSFTVELYMMSEKYLVEPIIKCFTETKLGVEFCSHMWNLKNFNSTASKDLILPQQVHLEMNLSMLNNENINIKMKLKKELNDYRFIGAKLSLLDAEKTVIVSQEDSHLMKSSFEDDWHFPKFIDKKLLKNSEKTNGVEFLLLCEFFLQNGTASSKTKYISDTYDPSNEKNDPTSILRVDLKQMYTNHVFSDIKLRIADQTFSAHKCILSARSPVFQTMFSQNMLENQSGVVEISDVDPKTFTAFLDFIYTEEIAEIDSNIALNLLVIANKYQVSSLEEKCSDFLVSNLSFSNVCEVAKVADMIGQKLLKKSSVGFIKTNAPKILSTVEWNKVIESNVKLASEIVRQLSSDLCSLSSLSYE